MKIKKLSVEAVTNGFIVRVLKENVSTFKESYDKPVFVFVTRDDLIAFLTEALSSS